MNEWNIPVWSEQVGTFSISACAHTHIHKKGLLTRGGEEMRGVALNERVRASVKEPGRVETGKSRLYLPEDVEGGGECEAREGWKREREASLGRRRGSPGTKAPRRLLRPSFPSLSPALLRRSTMKIVSENNAICSDAVGRNLCRAAPDSAARGGQTNCVKDCDVWDGHRRVPLWGHADPGARKKKNAPRSVEFRLVASWMEVNESCRSKEALQAESPGFVPPLASCPRGVFHCLLNRDSIGIPPMLDCTFKIPA